MFEKYIEISKTGASSLPGIVDISNISKSEADELHQIILGKHVNIALEQMLQDGILNQCIPGLRGVLSMKDKKKRFKDLWEHTKVVVQQSVPRLEIRWAALFHDFGKPECFNIVDGKIVFHDHEAQSVKYYKEFAKKYRIFDAKEYNKISFLIKNLGYVESYLPSWTDSAVRRFQKEMGDNLEDILLLSRADISTKNKAKRSGIQKSISELKRRSLNIRAKDGIKSPLPKGIGDAIIKLGIPAGKSIGNIKIYLEHKIKDGELLTNQNIEYYIAFLESKLAVNGLTVDIKSPSISHLIFEDDINKANNKVIDYKITIEDWQMLAGIFDDEN